MTTFQIQHPIAGQNFVQKAEAAFYSGGHWKSIGGILYHLRGQYYETAPEKPRKNVVLVIG